MPVAAASVVAPILALTSDSTVDSFGEQSFAGTVGCRLALEILKYTKAHTCRFKLDTTVLSTIVR